ncbi:MAG: Hpt domain-containing protein [Alphaproteobacteria bacterium]
MNIKALNALNVLRRSLSDSVHELISATQEHDYSRASTAAHAIIGASLTAGANALADFTKQMKETLDTRDVLEAGRFAEKVAFAFERLGDKIDALHLESKGSVPDNDDSRRQ